MALGHHPALAIVIKYPYSNANVANIKQVNIFSSKHTT